MSAEWQKPLAIPPLNVGAVQLWRLDATRGDAAGRLAAAAKLLTADEEARASRMRAEMARQEFILGRALVRLLLSGASGLTAGSLRIELGATGKPCCLEAAGVDFNVTHGHGLVLVAISRSGALGVDVEWLNAEFAGAQELNEMARESFTAEEFEMVAAAAPGRSRLLAFYQAWTRKEAVAKAQGSGIASMLDYRIFPTDAGGCCRVVIDSAASSRPGQQAGHYFVHTPDVGPDFVAAVAVCLSGQAIDTYDGSYLFK